MTDVAAALALITIPLAVAVSLSKWILARILGAAGEKLQASQRK